MPVISQHCVQPCSAQLAELKALTAACQLEKGQTANIFTDSAYAHGVTVHTRGREQEHADEDINSNKNI